MPSRELPYPLFDADNHLYETEEALTRYLPEQYAGAIRYVQVDGRTKIAVRGQISEYIPNPTSRWSRGPARWRTASRTATRKARAGGRDLRLLDEVDPRRP